MLRSKYSVHYVSPNILAIVTSSLLNSSGRVGACKRELLASKQRQPDFLLAHRQEQNGKVAFWGKDTIDLKTYGVSMDVGHRLILFVEILCEKGNEVSSLPFSSEEVQFIRTFSGWCC